MTTPEVWHKVATFSLGIARAKHTRALVGAANVRYWPMGADGIDAVVGWGLKNNSLRAVDFAHKHNLPYWRLEDGFLRSVDLGVEGDTALSMVRDDLGIYYDARRPSRLEQLLQEETRDLQEATLLNRAKRAIDDICRHGLSKYNASPVAPFQFPGTGAKRRVLVVDQTFGDQSVAAGLGSASSFTKMLHAAIAENPDAEIYVKTHPDVISGKKRGYLGDCTEESRVTLIAQDCNPNRLLEQVDKVYVVTSQLGFEALLVGKDVVCFGVPFYSGWGLTDDRVSIARRTRKRTLLEVFAATYILYSRYVDPDTGESCELERVIEHLALQREQFAKNQGRKFCFGFRVWKHGYVRGYLRCPGLGNEVHFPRDANHARRLGFDESSKIVVWGQRDTADVRELSEQFGVPIWRMEDGFLRSVGLGSDMTTPASLVVDRYGIYFDPRSPSELESILQNHQFSEEELKRGAHLREVLLATGLSKYNVGEQKVALPKTPRGRKMVLVPGQVEDDASIRLGCQGTNTNLGLLEAARRACPDDYIVFKPHPDVLSGNRLGHVPPEQARRVCDHIEEDATLATCLASADVVHVMTSLVGFEALLRGLEVHVHGQPFYAGWGLTTDTSPIPRRTRRLSIDELVAGTYLRYPRYLNRETLRFTQPEAVVRQLNDDRNRAGQKLKVTWSRRQLRKLRHISKEIVRGS